MSNNAVSLSTIQPDFDLILAQLQSAARTKNTWTSFLTTDVGKTLLEFMAAIGELDQYGIARNFEEMFSETADIESSLYGITKMLGVRLNRKSPAQTYYRLPDASNSGSGISASTANDIILRNAYLNPYYDVSIPLGGGATPAATRITNPIQFYSYGKIKRVVSAQFSSSSQLIILPYSRFTTSEGMLFNRLAIKFDAIADVSNPNDYGWFGYSENINNASIKEAPVLYRGDVNNKYFTATGQDFFTIISSENDFVVSDTDVEVYINQEKMDISYNGLWNFRSGEVNNKVVQDFTTSKGKLQILFGTDLYGFKPTPNDNIQLRYVTTKGSEDNTLKFKSTKMACIEYPIDNTTEASIYPLIDGGNETPAKNYSQMGPHLFASNNGQRGVTPQDYKVIFTSYAGNLDCVVDGQRNLNTDSPAFMNLVRAVTYPKHNEAFYTAMFTDIKQKTMFSNEFYTEWEDPDVPLYPLQRIFNIRANVYCFNIVDLVSARTAIENAILSLVDKNTFPLIGKMNINIPRETILKTIREAVLGIDYIELIEPQQDVTGDMEPPKPTAHIPNATNASDLVGSIDYAVEVFSESIVSGSPVLYSWSLSPIYTATGSGKQLEIYFEKVPNFQVTPPDLITTGISSSPYLASVQYRLWRKRKSVSNPVWEPVQSSPVTEASLAVNPATNLTFILDTGTTALPATPPYPQYNAARPAITLLDQNWSSVNTINMIYTTRVR